MTRLHSGTDGSTAKKGIRNEKHYNMVNISILQEMDKVTKISDLCISKLRQISRLRRLYRLQSYIKQNIKENESEKIPRTTRLTYTCENLS